MLILIRFWGLSKGRGKCITIYVIQWSGVASLSFALALHTFPQFFVLVQLNKFPVLHFGVESQT